MGASGGANLAVERLATQEGVDEVATRVNVELVEDVRQMRLDSSLADEEPVGDLASGKAVEHETRHILFTAAEAGQSLRQGGVGLLSV